MKLIMKSINNLFVLTILFIIQMSMIVSAEETNITKLTFGENRWIAIHYLLQAQGYSQNVYDNTVVPNELGIPAPLENESNDAIWSKRAKIRRSRIILKGQVAKNVTFFMETDDVLIKNDQTGANNKIFTQDAFISYKFADEFQISAGLILLPFMHHNRQSAVSLLGVDYNILIVPLGSITNVWRDLGVEVRGLLIPTLNGKNGLIDYRIGAWQGKERELWGTKDYSEDAYPSNDDVNPNNDIRYCGRIQINLLDPESGFFYSGNYLGKKKIVSFGGGLDYQRHARQLERPHAYLAQETFLKTIRHGQ